MRLFIVLVDKSCLTHDDIEIFKCELSARKRIDELREECDTYQYELLIQDTED